MVLIKQLSIAIDLVKIEVNAWRQLLPTSLKYLLIRIRKKLVEVWNNMGVSQC